MDLETAPQRIRGTDVDGTGSDSQCTAESGHAGKDGDGEIPPDNLRGAALIRLRHIQATVPRRTAAGRCDFAVYACHAGDRTI
ncbi:hypothetical protein GCM10011610_33770 [Nocardia rhizosphaerihabitans]|uniref:Uncharacterized protein n=1 Tax=Nocardia rhizosphaerihabitans TaxID=1691570 RepID=A0ABQ2KII5_9NOCA|nr:hypothetical protein GCM10011610_33770 [Nocardia rhizosphaerihabitans]